MLVTGCSSGIGRATVPYLRDRGFRVIASVRRAEDAAGLEAEGVPVVRLDYADADSVCSGFDAALAVAGGRLYGVFHNGAYGQPGALEDVPRQALEAQFQTNVFGWHQLTTLCIPVMRAAGSGRIVFNSSVLGFAAMPFRGAYSASKFAIEGLADTLRLELAGTGIAVSLVEPGPIRSQFRANALRAFDRYIDAERSVFCESYRAVRARLEKEGDVTPFSLQPEAVASCVLHALTARRPEPRYYVTTPTRVFGYLKRFLSSRAMDAVLRRAGGGGSR